MTSQQPLTLDFSEIRMRDVARVGGKNASLGELFNAVRDKGIHVLDGFATTASILASMFPGGIPMGLDPVTAAGIGYSLASTRWRQVQEAEDLPGKLAGFLSFAKATTPSLTESLYTQGAAQQAYVALVETTL